jgi:hypothetical protein
MDSVLHVEAEVLKEKEMTRISELAVLRCLCVVLIDDRTFR